VKATGAAVSCTAPNWGPHPADQVLLSHELELVAVPSAPALLHDCVSVCMCCGSRKEWHPTITINPRAFWVANGQQQLEKQEGVALHPLGRVPVHSKTVGIKASFPVGQLQVISCRHASDKGHGVEVVGLPSKVVRLPSVDLTDPIIVCEDDLCSSWRCVADIPHLFLLPISPLF
jgi:hypothetical protein